MQLQCFHWPPEAEDFFVQRIERHFGLPRERRVELCRWGNGGRGLNADKALVTCADVVKVGHFRHEIDFRERQATGGLFLIDAAANATLGTALDLVVRRLVLNIVVLSEIDQATIAQDIQVGSTSFKRNVFRRIKKLVVTDQLGLVEAPYFIARSKAIEQHLIQTEQITAARVVVARADGRLLEAFTATADSQVDTRKIATTGNPDFFVCRPIAMPLGGDFRAVQDCFLCNILKNRSPCCLGHGFLAERREGSSNEKGNKDNFFHGRQLN